MDLRSKTASYVQDDNAVFASRHGLDSARPIKIDPTTFTAGTHYPDGYLKQGVFLARRTSDGVWGRYDDAASDGRQVARGVLRASVEVSAPGVTATGTVWGALVERGDINLSELPTGHGYDTAAGTDLAAKFTFIGTAP